MGSHFSPPFAVIYMHSVETKALLKLKDQEIFPKLYARYIDDIILGPFVSSVDFKMIVNVFNSIDKNIQFTVEVPENQILNFLDISILVEKNTIRYWWYVKEMHSGVSLRHDSCVPNHVKSNHVNNSINRVKNRCKFEEDFEKSMLKLENRLKKNGFTTNGKRIGRKVNHAKNKSCKTFIKIKFTNDKTVRKIRNLIKKYKLSINLVSAPNKTLYQCLKNKHFASKHSDCVICDALPQYYTCSDRFLVYKFTCRSCPKFYIGQTCRPFKQRFYEHRRAIASGSSMSALAEHVHERNDLTILDFDLDILEKCGDPLETRLAEARWINTLKPALNRKHELTVF